MLPEIPPPPKKRRPRRLREKRLLLTEERILEWADAHHERTGQWPSQYSGRVAETLQETWSGLQQALRHGYRGLPGGTTLSRLLREQRGVRNVSPPLTVEQILAWADAHHRRTGQWPTTASGAIPEAPGEFWQNVGEAVRCGTRSLPGGDSLASLLERERGARNLKAPPALSIEQILAWADAFFDDRGRWPNHLGGPIPSSQGETWSGVETALQRGGRGLPGGSSLTRLFERERGVRNRKYPPPLTEEQILAWAREHQQRTGRWPNLNSGPVTAAPGEVWRAVNEVLIRGFRGLPGGDSLARLLERRLGVRHRNNLPPLTVKQILRWADAHFERTGRWPHDHSGVVTDAPAETWCALDLALRQGRRGLPGGLSLARLREQELGVRNHRNRPPLTEAQILAWADEHYQRTGRWPRAKEGPIPGSGGETWMAVYQALYDGLRGCPGGDSLLRLLKRHGRLPLDKSDNS